MNVRDMEWKDMEQMVTRRLNSLKMCKAGQIATDFNDQVKALGDVPTFTADEREEIQAALAKRIQKAMTPSLAEIRKVPPYELQKRISDRVAKIREAAFVHPDKAGYDKKLSLLKQQKAERDATLDGDFMDVADEFKLGIKKIEDFPAAYAKLEAMAW